MTQWTWKTITVTVRISSSVRMIFYIHIQKYSTNFQATSQLLCWFNLHKALTMVLFLLLLEKTTFSVNWRKNQICHLRLKRRFVTSDWEYYQRQTNRSQHPEPIHIRPQSEIVSLHPSSLTPRRWFSFLLQRLWGESEAKNRDMAEAVMGQVSGEDAKPSGQQVTERAAVTSCWLSRDRWDNQQAEARTVLQHGPHPVSEGSFPQHLKPELTFPSAAMWRWGCCSGMFSKSC